MCPTHITRHVPCPISQLSTAECSLDRFMHRMTNPACILPCRYAGMDDWRPFAQCRHYFDEPAAADGADDSSSAAMWEQTALERLRARKKGANPDKAAPADPSLASRRPRKVTPNAMDQRKRRPRADAQRKPGQPCDQTAAAAAAVSSAGADSRLENWRRDLQQLATQVRAVSTLCLLGCAPPAC